MKVLKVYEYESTGGSDMSELAVLIVSLGLPIIITPSLFSTLFFLSVFSHPPLRKDSDYPCADVLHNGISAASGAVN